MHDSVTSVKYSSICNVLRLWKTSLIPTYRVSMISKQSHVQHILLCPRMSRDNLGHPNNQYTVPAMISEDIPGHPSQLQYIHTFPFPAHPIVFQDVLGYSRTSQQDIHEQSRV